MEVRALDAQAALEDNAGLLAAVHALAHHEAHADPVTGPPAEILEEASFRAARAGVTATVPDGNGRLRPVAALLEETIELARPSALALGCEAELETLFDLVSRRGGAGRQRAAAGEDADVDAALGMLLVVA